MFVVLLTVIAAIVYNVGPRLSFRLLHRPTPLESRWLPVAATLVFAAAWFLPPLRVSQGSDTLLLHAVGGGVSATLISYHVGLNLRLPARGRAVLALAVVSVLGVANEILELLYDQVVGTHLSADASSDLFANTVGALAATRVCEAALRVRSAARAG